MNVWARIGDRIRHRTWHRVREHWDWAEAPGPTGPTQDWEPNRVVTQMRDWVQIRVRRDVGKFQTWIYLFEKINS